MDYLEKLSKSINELEQNASKLSVIPKLTQCLKELVKQTKMERQEIEEYLNHVVKIEDTLQKNSIEIEEVIQGNSIYYVKNVEIVKNELERHKNEINLLYDRTNAFVEKELMQSQKEHNKEIEETITYLKEELAKSKKETNSLLEEVIVAIKDELIKTKRDNLEVIESLSIRMTNAMAISEGNIQVYMNTKMEQMEQSLQKVYNKMDENILQIKELKKEVQMVKLIAIASSSIAILGLLVHFLA